MRLLPLLCLICGTFFSAFAIAAQPERLRQGDLEVVVEDAHFSLHKRGKQLFDLTRVYFNYEPVEKWQVRRRDGAQWVLSAELPASADFYRIATDVEPRRVELTVQLSAQGVRFYAAPAWGRQVSLEFAYLDDHFFGLSAPLQPDNRLSPDLTGTITHVDIHSEGAAYRENYASAFSAFFISSRGYGAFFDSFARGRYEFAINGRNLIHHDTGILDWHVFPGADGAEIHRAYFNLIGAPKKVPAWGLGPIGWRDQNSGAAQLLDDVEKMTALTMPFTAWFVDRPYSDGSHAWSKMNFSSAFAEPEKWIGRMRREYGLEFMTWVATATFGDARFARHLAGQFSYMDLSDAPTVRAYQRELEHLQHAVGVKGHKIDRADEGFPVTENWADGTEAPLRRNRYAYLLAKLHDESLRTTWGDDQLTFARAAMHRTQPYLSAIWGGDPRTTWDGLRANFANAMRSSFMGFPVWGTDVGGYQGEGYIPEALYLRWLQAGSMTGLFEIKLDGAGGSGRDRMPWQYGEEFQARFRAVLEDRMRLLPYLYSLANTSARTGVLMQPLAYRHLEDRNTYAIWDQFYVGGALLVAPVFDEGLERDIYLPRGNWRNYDDPAEFHKGGRRMVFRAGADTLPRFVRENSLFVTGDIYRGNDRRWRTQEPALTLHAFPADGTGEATFDYVDMLDGDARKSLRMEKAAGAVLLQGPAVKALRGIELILRKKPGAVVLNGAEVPVDYAADKGILRIDLPEMRGFEVRVVL